MEHELIHGCWLWLSGLNPYTSSTHRQGAESGGGGNNVERLAVDHNG